MPCRSSSEAAVACRSCKCLNTREDEVEPGEVQGRAGREGGRHPARRHGGLRHPLHERAVVQAGQVRRVHQVRPPEHIRGPLLLNSADEGPPRGPAQRQAPGHVRMLAAAAESLLGTAALQLTWLRVRVWVMARAICRDKYTCTPTDPPPSSMLMVSADFGARRECSTMVGKECQGAVMQMGSDGLRHLVGERRGGAGGR